MALLLVEHFGPSRIYRLVIGLNLIVATTGEQGGDQGKQGKQSDFHGVGLTYIQVV